MVGRPRGCNPRRFRHRPYPQLLHGGSVAGEQPHRVHGYLQSFYPRGRGQTRWASRALVGTGPANSAGLMASRSFVSSSSRRYVVLPITRRLSPERESASATTIAPGRKPPETLQLWIRGVTSSAKVWPGVARSGEECQRARRPVVNPSALARAQSGESTKSNSYDYNIRFVRIRIDQAI